MPDGVTWITTFGEGSRLEETKNRHHHIKRFTHRSAVSLPLIGISIIQRFTYRSAVSLPLIGIRIIQRFTYRSAVSLPLIHRSSKNIILSVAILASFCFLAASLFAPPPQWRR